MTASDNPPLFPEDAVIRRVDSERILILGGQRAILMQLAHPLVAQGVAEHSDFQRDPFERLRRTLDITYGVIFGTVEEAHQLAAQVRAVHDTVRGDGYEANDPDLLLWVTATLTDTALRVHARFLGGLSPRDAAQFYAETRTLNEVFGVPRDMQPPDLAAFRAYVRATVATLHVTDEARRLAHDVLHPRLPWPLALPAELGRQVTTALLPAPLRRQYGLSWDPVRAAAFEAAALASRQLLPRLPARLRRVA